MSGKIAINNLPFEPLFFLMSDPATFPSERDPVEHLLRPARGGAAGVVIVFSIGLGLAAQAGITGLPLGILLVSWYFK